LSQLVVPHTQNFEIPLKTQESKKIDISFENFKKMLDGSKYGKRCLLRISVQIFFQVWKILKFLLENLEFFLKKVKNLSKSVWVQARELKFCMYMFC
jgi:hypothetical protein